MVSLASLLMLLRRTPTPGSHSMKWDMVVVKPGFMAKYSAPRRRPFHQRVALRK